MEYFVILPWQEITKNTNEQHCCEVFLQLRKWPQMWNITLFWLL